MLLFVYGTLMYGMPAHGLLVGSVFAGRGVLRARLYLCDGYPLAVLGEEGVVWGELYHVDETVVPRIDHYEGADLPGSPWRPVNVEVDVLGLRVRARAYASRSAAEAERLCGELKPLEADDYRLVAGGGPPRWLIAVPSLSPPPPGIGLASSEGVARDVYAADDCLSPGGGEAEVTLYDILAGREELDEWARGLGCSLGGVEVDAGGRRLYPLAPLAGARG